MYLWRFFFKGGITNEYIKQFVTWILKTQGRSRILIPIETSLPSNIRSISSSSSPSTVILGPLVVNKEKQEKKNISSLATRLEERKKKVLWKRKGGGGLNMLRYHLRTVSNLRALWQRSEESASPDINKSLSIHCRPLLQVSFSYRPVTFRF